MNPITISQLAEFILGRRAEHGGDYDEAGLPIMGGCQRCGATIASYNSYPSTTGFLRCRSCIGDLGFATVEEAKASIFADETTPTGLEGGSGK